MTRQCTPAPDRRPKDMGELLAAYVELIGIHQADCARTDALAKLLASRPD